MTDAEAGQPMRRVRPWIAALLTFVGWGVGLYYARKTRAAMWWAIASIFVGIALILGVIAFTVTTQISPTALFDPDELSPLDFVNLGLTALLAAGVWIVTARTPNVPKGKPTRLWGYLGIWLLPMACMAVLALPVRFTLIQPFRMPSGSMQPTLHVGDYFAVTKWSYGYSRFSFTPFEQLLPSGRVMARAPKYGDIVVFRPEPQLDRDFVKRLIGLPGDNIQLRDGAVYLNGLPLKRESLGEVTFKESTGDYSPIQTWKETLPNGVSYTTFDRDASGRLDNTPVFEVPPGHYFFLGDDRDNSADSRTFEMGYVPFDNLLGRVDYVMQGPNARP